VAPERVSILDHSIMWFYFCSPLPEALLSRLPTGHLFCWGAYILHTVLALKFSALPVPLGKHALGILLSMAGSENLQMFLHVFFVVVVSISSGSVRALLHTA
jgi:hypothetical protein